MTQYDIRIARTSSELAAICRLRYETCVAKRRLSSEQARRTRAKLVEPEDDRAVHFIAEHRGRIVAAGRLRIASTLSLQARADFGFALFADLVSTERIAVAERLVIAPEHRGAQLSTSLFAFAWAHALERGVELITIGCEPSQLNHWIRLGFRPYGLFERAHEGALVSAAFVLGDIAHARSIGSPLCPALERFARSSARAHTLRGRVEQCAQIISETDDAVRFWQRLEAARGPQTLTRSLRVSEDTLPQLLRGAHIMTMVEGASLIRQGHQSRTLYVLLEGQLRVLDDGAHVAHVHAPGSIFGEVALLCESRRMSDVVVGRDGAVVIALSEPTLTGLLERRETAALPLLLSLTRDLSAKLRQRGRVQQQGSAPAPDPHLSLILTK